jgi:hypothetical protein
VADHVSVNLHNNHRAADDIGVNLHLSLHEPDDIGADLKPYKGRLEIEQDGTQYVDE